MGHELLILPPPPPPQFVLLWGEPSAPCIQETFFHLSYKAKEKQGCPNRLIMPNKVTNKEAACGNGDRLC